jgi:hypothetical protein
VNHRLAKTVVVIFHRETGTYPGFLYGELMQKLSDFTIHRGPPRVGFYHEGVPHVWVCARCGDLIESGAESSWTD